MRNMMFVKSFHEEKLGICVTFRATNRHFRQSLVLARYFFLAEIVWLLWGKTRVLTCGPKWYFLRGSKMLDFSSKGSNVQGSKVSNRLCLRNWGSTQISMPQMHGKVSKERTVAAAAYIYVYILTNAAIYIASEAGRSNTYSSSRSILSGAMRDNECSTRVCRYVLINRETSQLS